MKSVKLLRQNHLYASERLQLQRSLLGRFLETARYVQPGTNRTHTLQQPFLYSEDCGVYIFIGACVRKLLDSLCQLFYASVNAAQHLSVDIQLPCALSLVMAAKLLTCVV